MNVIRYITNFFQLRIKKHEPSEGADAHKDWTEKDWIVILWIDESQMMDEEHHRVWVTLNLSILHLKLCKIYTNPQTNKFETLEIFYLMSKIKRLGSMFWVKKTVGIGV